MDKLSELKAERALAADKLECITEGPDDKFDAVAVAGLEKQIKGLNTRIEAIEASRGLQSALAVKSPGQANTLTTPLDHTQYARYGKLHAFTNDKAGMEKAYRVGQFCRAVLFGEEKAIEWCRENGVPMAKAQAEGVNTLGGVLVPEEMMAAIIVLRETYGVFRRECRVIPMSRDTLNWPRRTGGLTAYFVGENQALTESTAAFDNVNLTAKKLGALTRLSTEIDEDAIINIGDYIVQEIAYAFASKEDDCGFNGDGTSTYGGMRGLTVLAVDGNHNAGKYTAASGHNTFATLDTTDITGLMGILPQYALTNGKFYVSQVAFATTFERLIANAGGNSISTLDGAISYRYLGYPIVISQKLPLVQTTLTTKAMMFFGDLTLAAAMGERRGVTIRRLNERFADSDQIGIMGTERFDINVHDMGDNTNPGPLVSLVAP